MHISGKKREIDIVCNVLSVVCDSPLSVVGDSPLSVVCDSPY